MAWVAKGPGQRARFTALPVLPLPDASTAQIEEVAASAEEPAGQPTAEAIAVATRAGGAAPRAEALAASTAEVPKRALLVRSPRTRAQVILHAYAAWKERAAIREWLATRERLAKTELPPTSLRQLRTQHAAEREAAAARHTTPDEIQSLGQRWPASSDRAQAQSASGED